MDLSFGCFIYQDGLTYQDILEISRNCEKNGFNSIWLKDNLTSWLRFQIHGWEQPANASILECLTTLSAIAAETTKIFVGAILCNTLRTPSLVAKAAACLDIISHGRLAIGLSAGWHEYEHIAYGIPFPKPATRLGMLHDSTRILTALFQNQRVYFRGKHFALRGAIISPPHVGKRQLPIWLGGGGAKTLRIAAKLAEGWNFGLCSYDEYATRLRFLLAECRAANRSLPTIKIAWQGIVFIGRNKQEAEARMMKAGIADPDRYGVLAGTPDQIAASLKKYVSLGVGTFTPFFPDASDPEVLELFMNEIAPCLVNK